MTQILVHGCGVPGRFGYERYKENEPTAADLWPIDLIVIFGV
jgi:hypothetical protein